MPLVNSSIPNLVNGVSQQPFPLRLATQGEVQENAYSSPVEGLRKRPPTRYEFMVGDAEFASTKILSHLINRDTSERYQMLVSSTGIKVFDLLTKESIPVSYDTEEARGYLECDSPATQLRAMTVADHTFILNKTITAASLEDLVTTQRPEGLIWVKQGSYGSTYTITLDSTTVTFKTAGRSATTEEWSAGWRYENDDQTQATMPSSYTATPPKELPRVMTASLVATEYIAEKLRLLLANNPTLRTKFQFSRVGSLIRIRTFGTTTGSVTTYPDFSLSSEDSLGDSILKAFKDRAQYFTDLPQRCFNGFRIKVMGDGATEFDDYYVKYEGTYTGGVWTETLASDQPYKLDPDTLPHALVRQEDGTFLFKALDWEPRNVGDEDSNPLPSFIGKRIQDIFFFRNRFGMAAQENVVMSRAGDFYNFFRASATQVLDSDPIDIAVSHVKVSDINHVIPYNETLLLFAQGVQFQLNDTDLLTPKTVAFSQVTDFDCSPRCRPAGLGSYLYFVQDRGSYSAVREYLVDRDSSANVAQDITSHVPRYIPGDIETLTVSSQENVILALSSKENNVIYVHKLYWDGDQKLQSSWSKWIFDEGVNVLATEFVNSKVWITTLRSGVVHMETMDLQPDATDDEFAYQVYLDHRVDEGDTYLTSTPDRQYQTRIKLPFPVIPGSLLIAKSGNSESSEYTAGRALFRGYVKGELVEWVQDPDDPHTIMVEFPIQRFFFGAPYKMLYRLSPLVLRKNDGDGPKAVVDGRLQIRKIALQYAESGYFRVEVTPQARDTYTYKMTSKTAGIITTRVGQQSVNTGTIRIPIMAQNDKVTVDLINDSHLPSAFLSADWEAIYVSLSRRI